jgi:hypothetical protein
MARVMARLRPTSLTTRGGLGRAGQVGDRHGRAAGQGDADRQHDPPDAARGGHRSTTPAGHGCAGSTRPRSPSSRRAWPLSWSRSWNGSHCRSPTTRSSPTRSCGSRRHSWSAGWRGLFHGRPPCSPSRWWPGPAGAEAPGVAAGAGRLTPPQPGGRRARATAGCTLSVPEPEDGVADEQGARRPDCEDQGPEPGRVGIARAGADCLPCRCWAGTPGAVRIQSAVENSSRSACHQQEQHDAQGHDCAAQSGSDADGQRRD